MDITPGMEFFLQFFMYILIACIAWDIHQIRKLLDPTMETEEQNS